MRPLLHLQQLVLLVTRWKSDGEHSVIVREGSQMAEVLVVRKSKAHGGAKLWFLPSRSSGEGEGGDQWGHTAAGEQHGVDVGNLLVHLDEARCQFFQKMDGGSQPLLVCRYHCPAAEAFPFAGETNFVEWITLHSCLRVGSQAHNEVLATLVGPAISPCGYFSGCTGETRQPPAISVRCRLSAHPDPVARLCRDAGQTEGWRTQDVLVGTGQNWVAEQSSSPHHGVPLPAQALFLRL